MRGNQLYLQDISRNGTWVNGQRIYGEMLIKTGDIIRIGEQTLQVKFGN